MSWRYWEGGRSAEGLLRTASVTVGKGGLALRSRILSRNSKAFRNGLSPRLPDSRVQSGGAGWVRTKTSDTHSLDEKQFSNLSFLVHGILLKAPETWQERSGSSRVVNTLAGLKDFLRPFCSFRNYAVNSASIAFLICSSVKTRFLLRPYSCTIRTKFTGSSFFFFTLIRVCS